MQPILGTELVRVARSMIGRHEEPRGSNRGPQIQEFFDADYYKPNAADNGYAWCASFVDRCVQLAMLHLDIPETATFKRPRTPSAFGLIDWSLAQDSTTKTIYGPTKNIQAGDIVVLAHSHVVVAVGPVDDATGLFPQISGNTSLAGSREGTDVLEHNTSWTAVKAVIRFTI